MPKPSKDNPLDQTKITNNVKLLNEVATNPLAYNPSFYNLPLFEQISKSSNLKAPFSSEVADSTTLFRQNALQNPTLRASYEKLYFLYSFFNRTYTFSKKQASLKTYFGYEKFEELVNAESELLLDGETFNSFFMSDMKDDKFEEFRKKCLVQNGLNFKKFKFEDRLKMAKLFQNDQLNLDIFTQNMLK